MQAFEFLRPKTLSELTVVLAETGGSLLAGGTDLIPKIKRSQFSASILIDASRIDELRFIRKRDGQIEIGALTTHQEIADSQLLTEVNPALVTAARSVGCEQTRNRGTLGGNIANASPAADAIPPLLIFDANIHLLGNLGERMIPLDDFLISPGKTKMNPGEFIYSVSFQPLSEAWGSAFLKLGKRKGMAISVASVAAMISLDTEKKITKIRLCLGSVAPRVVYSPRVEEILIGQYPTRKILERASQACQADIAPISDVRSTADYRLHSATILTRRVLEQAVDQAMGKLI